MRLEGILQQLQISYTANIMDLLKNLDNGDVVRVQVVEASGSELLLKLPDGRLFKAATLVDTAASKGEVLELQVNNKSDTQIFMEILKPVHDRALEAARQLKELDIPLESSNIAAVGYLGEEDLPVSREVINLISQITSSFKIQPELAAFSASYGITPNEADIKFLSFLSDGTFRLGDELDQLIKLAETLTAAGNTLDGAQINSNGNNADTLLYIKKQLQEMLINIDRREPAAQQGTKHDHLLTSELITRQVSTLAQELETKASPEQILRMLNDIKQAVINAGNTGGITERLDRLENGVRVINNLDGQLAYLQLPVQIEGHTAACEIFIKKRNGKRRGIDPESTTMLISLNTQNLGLVESLVSVDRKSIRLKFHAQRQEVIDFFKESYLDLYQNLSQAGYKMVDIKYRLVKEKTGILNAGSSLRHEFPERYASFDFRI